jgi:hypothetical protein
VSNRHVRLADMVKAEALGRIRCGHATEYLGFLGDFVPPNGLGRRRTLVGDGGARIVERWYAGCNCAASSPAMRATSQEVSSDYLTDCPAFY